MRKQHDQDFSKDLDESRLSHKDRLIQSCQNRKISIYVDDAVEASSGAYAGLRGVASEAELERRLTASKALGHARWANVVAVISLIVSVIAFIKTFL